MTPVRSTNDTGDCLPQNAAVVRIVGACGAGDRQLLRGREWGDHRARRATV